MTEKNDKRTWYAMRKADASHGVDEVYIYDRIGGWGVTAAMFVDEWRALEGKEVNLYLNSPGGEVPDAWSIYNVIQRTEKPVKVYVDGWAVSAASLVAIAGDATYMGHGAQMMIHDPWTFSAGNSRELRKTADVLEQMKGPIVGAYARKSRKEAEEIAAMMTEETWFTGPGAVEFGLADGLIDGAGVQNVFREAPRAEFDPLAYSIHRQETERKWWSGRPVRAGEAEGVAADKPRDLNGRDSVMDTKKEVPSAQPAKADVEEHKDAVTEPVDTEKDKDLARLIDVAAMKRSQEAVAEERTRIAAIKRNQWGSHQEELANELIEKGVPVLEAIEKLNAHQRDHQHKTLEQMRADTDYDLAPAGEPKLKKKNPDGVVNQQLAEAADKYASEHQMTYAQALIALARKEGAQFE
jgi:ATP-dependent protease ClpP protease subunit